MIDRYDEVMTALYTGTVPAWVPDAKRDVFARESLRRRCELGAQLRGSWPCTNFYARCTLGEDFAVAVFEHWPTACRAATDVTTGLYRSLKQAIAAAGTPPALSALLQYETLSLTLGSCDVDVPRVPAADVAAAGLWGEVYRFELRVPELWSRMKLYHASLAPACFVREYNPVHAATYIARSGPGQLDDVTEAFVG